MVLFTPYYHEGNPSVITPIQKGKMKMAREKGMGSLQLEKSGRYTARVCIGGKRFSRSTRTTNREKAERFLNKFLAPFGLGEKTIPLAEVWREYEKSPNRRDMATSTIASKKGVWMRFASWIEENHVEITQLKQLSQDAVSEYLRVLRAWHTASTYNNHVCVLREIFHVVADKAGVVDDPWASVRLLADDSHCRREFTRDELKRIMAAAERAGNDWLALFSIGVYTGLRLGDCCTLAWSSVNLGTGIIQLVPHKTRKHAGGKPVTIPIHPSLKSILIGRSQIQPSSDSPFPVPHSQLGYVIPTLAEWYLKFNWRVRHGLSSIFKDADIVTSIPIEGRRKQTPDATFHSLRHTFVSFSANAGVPLPVVSSIVGHSSSAMTRHYYHENEEALRRAVESVPSIAAIKSGCKHPESEAAAESRTCQNSSYGKRIPQRLKHLDRLFKDGLLSEAEFTEARRRIIAEI